MGMQYVKLNDWNDIPKLNVWGKEEEKEEGDYKIVQNATELILVGNY